VQVLLNGFRYEASELNGTLTFHRDGVNIGKATWKQEQLILSSAILPDDAVLALDKKLKEAFDAEWWED
jgi:hypothetical protein